MQHEKHQDHRVVQGVHVIRVRGSATERARAHAVLLKDQIKQGALLSLAKKNEWIIRRSPGIIQIPFIQNLVVWFYRDILLRYLQHRNPSELGNLIRVLSEETGISYSDLLQSVYQPDGLMLLSRLSVMKYTLRDSPLLALPGCTSAVTLKDWTGCGRLLACRNQDYPMVGPWERNTTVVFHEPSEKDQIPHVGITTAGVHTAGLTAMNREGLTLFTHAHFGRSVTLNGTPVVDIGNEIIRKAKTLGQAVDIARKHRPYANWTFVVSSARENDAAAFEMTPKQMVVRHAKDGFLAHTNFFQSPELRAQEALVCGGVLEDVIGRLNRMREMLEPFRGKLAPENMAEALGDHIDSHTGEERVVGNTVSVVTTVKSTVWDPEAQKFWVSTRQESPTGLGDYIEIDAQGFWDGFDKGTSQDLEGNWPTLPGYQPKNPSLIEAIQYYREAYQAFHMESHLPDYRERALIALRKAVRVFPEDGNLWVQAGILAFGLHFFDEAKSCFERTREMKLSTHTTAVRNLFLARCLDLLSRRQEAVEIYRTGVQVDDPMLRRAMKKGLKRAYRAKDTASIMIDLQFPDTLHY